MLARLFVSESVGQWKPCRTANRAGGKERKEISLTWTRLLNWPRSSGCVLFYGWGRRFPQLRFTNSPQVLESRKSCSLAGTRRTSGLGKAGATIRRSSYEIAFIRVPCYCCYCSSAGVRNAAAAGGRIAELEVTPVLSVAREECQERGRGVRVWVWYSGSCRYEGCRDTLHKTAVFSTRLVLRGSRYRRILTNIALLPALVKRKHQLDQGPTRRTTRQTWVNP